MYIESLKLETDNKFIKDYYNQIPKLMENFDYNPYEESIFHQRLTDLKHRTFQRDALVTVLEQLNVHWQADKATLTRIQQLKEKESVVVIGGQQAGLLTGPLYTIHKIISIIQLAKKQERELQVPVIPVFWVAGEDHDYDEINHVYLPEETTFKKITWYDQVNDKLSVSHKKFDKEIGREWLREVFFHLEESPFTKGLYEKMLRILEDSTSYTDFFAIFIQHLFRGTGLVLIDSANEQVRKLESEYFQHMIKNQHVIAPNVQRQLQKLRLQGYHISVEVKEDDGHLFIKHNNERILLKRSKDIWVGKNNECSYSESELLDIAQNQPELLSNNVVTRPLMQELLFPTLAFLGGPSEVGYWSILKPLFETFSISMPPVLPRASITIIEKKIKKELIERSMELNDVIRNGVMDKKISWLESKTNKPLPLMEKNIKELIAKVHSPLRKEAEVLGVDILNYANKNLTYIENYVEDMVRRLQKEIESIHEKELRSFDLVEMHLHPDNGLQERVWNIIYYLNKFGEDSLRVLLDAEMEINDQHYIFHIQ
jgi:bacillithiol synthase